MSEIYYLGESKKILFQQLALLSEESMKMTEDGIKAVSNVADLAEISKAMVAIAQFINR